MKKKILCFCLAAVLLFGLGACGQTSMENLGENTDLNVVSDGKMDARVVAQMEFSVELFRQITANSRGDNKIISPLSAVIALAMVSNGGSDEVKKQAEQVLGKSVDVYNKFLKQYLCDLQVHGSGEPEGSLHSATGVWYREKTVQINPEFAATVQNYYGALVESSAFDQAALDQVNQWVFDNTNGQIDGISGEFSDNMDLYIVNALGFEALWQVQNRGELPQGVFTNGKGEEETATYLNTTIFGGYFELGRAVGFVRPLKGNFEFVAVLPHKSTTPEQFAQSLEPEELRQAIENTSGTVRCSMPKFSFEYQTSLGSTLQRMGLYQAFDSKVNGFPNLGTSEHRLYVEDIAQKNVIEVTELGIQAASVTEIPVGAGNVEEMKYVELNRPFLFMIVDSGYHLPIFIGIVNSVV